MQHICPRLERKLQQLPTPDPDDAVEIPIGQLHELEPFGDGAEGRAARGTRVGAGDEPTPALEPFVDTKRAAAFAAIKPARLLDLVRAGKVRAYSVGLGLQRHQWVFRLSELADDISGLRQPNRASMAAAALVSRRRQSNG